MRKNFLFVFGIVAVLTVSDMYADRVEIEYTDVESEYTSPDEIYCGLAPSANFTYRDGALCVTFDNIRLYGNVELMAWKAIVEDSHINFNLNADRCACPGYGQTLSHHLSFKMPLPPGVYSAEFGEELYREMNKAERGWSYSEITDFPEFKLEVTEDMNLTVNVDYPNLDEMLSEEIEWLYGPGESDTDQPGMFYMCRFKGSELINGIEYKKLFYCPSENKFDYPGDRTDFWNDNNSHLIAYMRHDGNSLYTYPVDDNLPESLWVYRGEGTVNPHDTFTEEMMVYSVLPAMYPEKLTVPDVAVRSMATLEVLTYNWKHDKTFTLTNGVEWAFGEGSSGRGCQLLPYPVYSYMNYSPHPIKLIKKRKISDLDHNEVSAIQSENANLQPALYDLQGLPVAEPAAGQMVIEQTMSETRKVIR